MQNLFGPKISLSLDDAVPGVGVRPNKHSDLVASLRQQQEQNIFTRTDRLFAVLMVCQWVAGIVAALLISPRTWAGQWGTTHLHVWAALFLGGLITALPVYFALTRPGEAVTRHVIAIGQMLMSALLIHLSGGRIETHFHVFGSLAFLACYRDPRVLLSASFVVIFDHLLRGIFWPQSVFGVITPNHWRWVEHAGWVVFEVVFLLISVAQSRREMLNIAEREASMAESNEMLQRARNEAEHAREEADRSRVEAERARAEAETANRAKSEFLSRMSHELRTPLNAILGFGQLLEMEDLEKAQQENVGYIMRGGRHLLTLINEVLDITRIETGSLAISSEAVSVCDILDECLQLVRPLAAQRKVELHADPQCHSLDDNGVRPGDRFIQADHQRFRQVVLNLLSNAIKYNREGGEVWLNCVPIDAGTWRLQVRDSGAGIEPEKIGRLFQPFDRLGAEQTEIEGTGIGLALSKRLVELMGGRMGVESTSGQGSTFWFEMQAATDPVQRAETVDIPLLSTDVELQTTTHKVLYIEDNKPNLDLVQLILQRRGGIELLSATDGLTGIEMAQQHRPDLILLDLNLPVMSGVEVLELIKTSPVRQTPIVVISADATPGQIERLVAAGAHTYLTKPLDVRQFLQVVNEILREIPARDEVKPALLDATPLQVSHVPIAAAVIKP
jgi:signal transduction histidine kinase/AmiR/NasT family two-component response regulator